MAQADVPTFAGDRSMRVNYEQGVDAYYQSTGADYRNPHFGSIVAATQAVMEAWWAAAQPGKDGSIRLLDLACGSGEATQAIEAWWQGKCGGSAIGSAAASQQPSGQGCEGWRGAGYQGGEDPQGQAGAGEREAGGVGTQGDAERGLARAAASSTAATAAGEGAAAALAGLGTTTTTTAATASAQAARPAAAGIDKAQGVTQQRLPQLIMDACDPYTYEAFEKWVGRPAERWTFQDIADGCLSDRSYDLAISSYALHVLDDSKLFSTLMQLSLVTKHLVVLSPHKKPHIGPHMGWQLVQHSVIERVHAWLYESSNAFW